MRCDKMRKRDWRMYPLLAVLTGILMALTAGCLFAFHRQTQQVAKVREQEYTALRSHYVLICEENDAFWDGVYEGAAAWAKENQIALERFGKTLAVPYTRAQRMKMAIAAGVDGILLQADETEEMGALINEAVDAGIPVVTVMDDHYGSRQQSFVGLSSYALGREYGRQIIHNATTQTRRALILMDANTDDSAQNILYNGIAETLANEGNHLTLSLETAAMPDESEFGPEQEVRALLRSGTPPEIIVCLDEKTTVCVCQTVVDLNLVGQVRIIGSYTNSTILNAIDRGVLAATVAVDTRAMGERAAEALDTYVCTGHVNDFVTMDADAVTRNNVKEYLKDAA